MRAMISAASPRAGTAPAAPARAGQAFAPAIGNEQRVERVARHRLAGERIDHDLALRHAQLDQEVARKRDSARAEADLAGDLGIEHGERDRTPRRVCSTAQVAVLRVVVVVDVAGEAELLKKKRLSSATAASAPRPGDARLQARRQRVDLGEHALAIERGVVVVGQGDRRLQDRKARVVGDERGEILERGRRVEQQGPGHRHKFRASATAAAARRRRAPSGAA
jgi:hypothetical protein